MKFSWLCAFSIAAATLFAQPVSADPAALRAHGMVVTEQALATEVGRAILEQGGNAVDAAVAIGYAEAVVYPCCGNIGGGGFMLLHRARAGDFFLDFRETAPQTASAGMYLNRLGSPIAGASLYGWRAAGVPGTVMGLETARQRFGTMSRAALMAPAIALARDGFVLGPQDAALIAGAVHLGESAETAAIFYHAGKPLIAGDRLFQPDLAATLERIAKGGTAAFYRGSLPRQVSAAALAANGILMPEDFARYRAKWRAPVHCRYRGYDVVSAPPPSSGGVALCEALNILSGYDLKGLGFHSASAIQRIAEAERHAFLDRNNALGDPDFVADDVAHLTSMSYADAIRGTIRADIATPSASLPPGTAPHEKYETTHYSVVDATGNAVSVTYTVNGRFGAEVMAPGAGFLMNDEMDDFTTAPGQPNLFGLRQGARNVIAPDKRPLSSMAPTLVLRGGKLAMVLGSPNGPRIISVVLQTILNVIDFGMPLDQAVAAPRIHEQYLPDTLFAEPGALDPGTAAALAKMGYALKDIPPFGASEAIEAVDGKWLGVNDPRSPAGAALGY